MPPRRTLHGAPTHLIFVQLEEHTRDQTAAAEIGPDDAVATG